MPQACTGLGNTGEQIHKVSPLYTDEKEVNREIRGLDVVLNSRKKMTEWCPGKCKKLAPDGWSTKAAWKSGVCSRI